MVSERLLRDLEQLALAVRHAHLDLVADLDAIGGDVRRDAVHGEVAVGDHLARRRPRRGEPEAEDDVVEALLERTEQCLAGDAGVMRRLDEVVAELLLEHAVDAADLLLLAKLEAVVAHLAAADAMLPGRRRAPLERALLGVAAAALEEELQPFAAAEPADGVGVTGHDLSVLRRGAAWAGGIRCEGWA